MYSFTPHFDGVDDGASGIYYYVKRCENERVHVVAASVPSLPIRTHMGECIYLTGANICSEESFLPVSVLISFITNQQEIFHSILQLAKQCTALRPKLVY